jgi:hypothetical protein
MLNELQPHPLELLRREQRRIQRLAVLEDRRSLLELRRDDLQDAVEPPPIGQVVAFVEGLYVRGVGHWGV